MMKIAKPKAYQPPTQITVRGATSPQGKAYVRVTASGVHAWVPRSAFTGGGGQALTLLKAANMPFLSHEWAQCRKKVAAVESYPLEPLIERPGRNGEYFALPDGTVFSPPGVGTPEVLFQKNANKCARAGTIEMWLEATELLKDQPLATFVLLAAFVPPFLGLTNQVMNQGFELAGPAGVGKSTLQRFAAAVWGPADDPSGLNYWINANTTMNALESVMAEHRDMALIIEEMNLYASGESAGVRRRKLNEFVFKLANGTEKLRFGAADPQRAQFGFITSTNEPLSEMLLGSQVALADAAADRLLTIPVTAERPYGILDSLPKGFRNGSELAEHLNGVIRKCHGVAIRQLLARLVEDTAANPQAVAKRLQKRVGIFRRKVGVDGNDGSATRVADAFGMVYAVSVFVQRYKAVWFRVAPLTAALTCYYLHQTTRGKREDPVKLLDSLTDSWETPYIVHGRYYEMSDEELEEHHAIFREGRGGQMELLLTEDQLKRAVGNVRVFLAHPSVQQMLLHEPGRKQTKRQVRSNRPFDRFFCFRSPRWQGPLLG